MTYDDFEDGTLDAWTVEEYGETTVTASTDAKKFGSYGCRFTCVNNQGRIGKTAGDATGNYYIWFRTSSVADTEFFFSTDGNLNIAQFALRVNRDGDLLYSDTTGWANKFDETIEDDTWYRLRADYNGTLVSYYLYDSDNNELEKHENLTPKVTGNIGKSYIQTGSPGETYTIDVDNVCYSDTAEPSPPPPTGQYMVTNKYW